MKAFNHMPKLYGLGSLCQCMEQNIRNENVIKMAKTEDIHYAYLYHTNTSHWTPLEQTIGKL